MPEQFILQNETLSAVVLSYGATLAKLCFTEYDKNLILGFSDPADYQNVPIYAGAIVGPLANRLKGGQAIVDGLSVQMPRNESDKTCLHSGPKGLHNRNWTLVSHTQTIVTLRCKLDHEDCGLPGVRDIQATYALEGNSLCLHMTATSDRMTLMNLAHHPYWVTNGHARLRISANSYLPIDEDTLPTGQIADVDGTLFDLRKACPVPASLDHNFVLSTDPKEMPRAVAWLEMPHYTLQLATTAPGLQVYAGAGLPKLAAKRTTGWPVEPLSGVALEPQFWPDAPHHPGFPSVNLAPHTQWSQFTRYTLEK